MTLQYKALKDIVRKGENVGYKKHQPISGCAFQTELHEPKLLLSLTLYQTTKFWTCPT